MIDSQDLADLEAVLRHIDHAVGDGTYRALRSPEKALEEVSRRAAEGLRILHAIRQRTGSRFP